jgi:hypothetical protein
MRYLSQGEHIFRGSFHFLSLPSYAPFVCFSKRGRTYTNYFLLGIGFENHQKGEFVVLSFDDM